MYQKQLLDRKISKPETRGRRARLFTANLLIALREGVEAALVVGILYAYVVQVGRRDVLPKLWLGVLLGAVIPLLMGAYMTWGTYTLTFEAQEIIGGSLSLVAVAFITWMIFWMAENAGQMVKNLKEQAKQKLGTGHGSGWSMFWIALITVGREGIETAVFVWGVMQSALGDKNGWWAAAGVIIGLVVAIIIGVLIYRGIARINLSVFFTVTGYLLVLVAAGVIMYGIGDLQEASVLPGWGTPIFDFTSYVPQTGLFGLSGPIYALLEAMFQLNFAPTHLQFIGWLVYLLVIGYLFTRQNRQHNQEAQARKDKKAEASAENLIFNQLKAEIKP